MARKKLLYLKGIVNSEAEKVERRYLENKRQASEVAISSANSPSQSGDRYHSEGNEIIIKNYLEKLHKLERDIEKEDINENPVKARPVCWIKVKEEKNRSNEYFFVNEVVKIKNIDFVSIESVLGSKLVNKTAGDKICINSKNLKIIAIG